MQADELRRLVNAIEAVKSKQLSSRKAATTFNVKRGKILRRVSGEVKLIARNEPDPTLIDGETDRILTAVIDRTTKAKCFTMDELACFIRKVVEESPYRRGVCETFPSRRYVQLLVKKHTEFFSRRSAQPLEECRAAASTETTVATHFANVKSTMETMGPFTSDGLNPDKVPVPSINDEEMAANRVCKKAKLARSSSDYVHGAILMTADGVIPEVADNEQARVETERAKVERSNTRARGHSDRYSSYQNATRVGKTS